MCPVGGSGNFGRMRVVASLLLVIGSGVSQELLGRRFGRPEGLPHEQVRCLLQDLRGYLWVGTAGRVCRCDGSALRPWPSTAWVPERVDRLAVAPDGNLFLGATGPSLHAYRPEESPYFSTFELVGAGLGRNVTGLAVDGRNQLYVATEAGLFIAELQGRACVLRALHRDERNMWYGAVVADRGGRLIYARSGLAVRRDGELETSVELAFAQGNVWAIEPIDDHRCRVLGDGHLCEVDFAEGTCKALPTPPLGGKRCTALATDRRGVTWLGTIEGLWRCSAPPQLVLPDAWIQTLYVDRCGDVWVGTQQHGLLRASARPFAQLRGEGANGLIKPVRLIRTAEAVWAVSLADGLYRVEGRELRATKASAHKELCNGSDVEADAHGSFWFATGDAMLQLPIDQIDNAGSMWRRWAIAGKRLGRGAVGNLHATTGNAVVEFGPAGESGAVMRQYPLPPSLRGGRVVADDMRSGWYYRAPDGGLWWLAPPRCEPCTDHGTLLYAQQVHQEAGGRMWIVPSNRSGVAIAEPERGAALDPQWLDAMRLPGDRAMGVATDGSGAAWLAFAGGLCHFEPSTGLARNWPWPDDAGIGGVHGVAVDSAGRVLVATDDHVVALDPDAGLPVELPAVLVTSVLVDGHVVPLPDGGTTTIGEIVMSAGTGSLVLGFCSPLSPTGAARVQYRLLPEEAEFGLPLQEPQLRLAGLAAGSYRLELRAAATDCAPAGGATVVDLRVLPPLWARTEFVLAGLGLAIAIGVLLHRLHVGRLLALEAVRRQVATDLHDDLGSGLAEVAALSELAKRTLGSAVDRLDAIGSLARAMRESLGDIVWAVDPTKDTLAAVVDRLRQVAGNLFADSEVVVRFVVPPGAVLEAAILRPDRRRHWFLFAKEALTNAARHARARQVTVTVAVSRTDLRMAIDDDGCGFTPGQEHGGLGLRSLTARAAALGAKLELRSAPGQGTSIALDQASSD